MPEEDPNARVSPPGSYARYFRPKYAWAAVGALATIGGFFAFLALFGLTLPFTSGTSDAELITQLEQKVDRLPEYLADLDETQKETLKAAYEEGRRLQLEGYQAQDEEKHVEAIDRFARALALAETDAQQAALYILRGNSYLSVSNFPSAQDDYVAAIVLADRLSDPDEANEARAAALGDLGIVFMKQGDLKRAEEHYQAALAIHREIGNRLGEAAGLGNLGLVYEQQGDLDRAEEHHQASLTVDREIGNRLGEAYSLGNLGIVFTQQGDLDRAEEYHQAALAIHREIGSRLGEASVLGNLGLVYAEQGDLGRAEEHHKSSLTIDREIGNRLGEALDLHNLGNVYYRQGDLERAEEQYHAALAIDREIGHRLGEADTLGNLGFVAANRDERAEACRLLKEAAAIYADIGAGGEDPDMVRAKLEELGCE